MHKANEDGIQKARNHLMLEKRVVQVNIKTVSKSDISGFPFNRICHVQYSPRFQWFWVLLSEVNMNNLQEVEPIT